MIRKLQLLVAAVVLVIAAFSTALPFLFYLLYLAILVVGGSPGHRRNILEPAYTHLGIGISTKGKEYYVTQSFGASSNNSP